MRVVIADPREATVTEREINEDDFLNTLYDIIGCRFVTVASISPVLDAWVDDEGLLTNAARWLTYVDGYHSPLAGKIVFTGGAGPDGETLTCKTSVEYIESIVHFQLLPV